MQPRGWWIDAAIVLLAFTLRIAWLELKPPHFDEGVNGWFVDEMTRTGFYHYDPGNFHGPLHFYALFVSLTLFGRKVWALRLPIVLVSTLCVAAMLAFRSYLPRRACRLAAIAAAVSPGCVFYGRTAIHESWLLLFLLTTVWGGAGLWRGGGRRATWATALGLTGMVLTKETYALHGFALASAVPVLLLLEKCSPSAGFARAPRRRAISDLNCPLVVSCAVLVFFYTGGLLDWSSLAGVLQTFAKWRHTATAGLSGHEKEWTYFFELIVRDEWPALFGLAAVAGLARRGADRLLRFLGIYGCAALIGYSLIAYKTPWCVIMLLWPFYFIFGMAANRLMETLDRWTIGVATALLFAFSLAQSWSLNFQRCTDEEEPYVYVQTLPDIEKLLTPLRALATRDPLGSFITGDVLTVDHHPLIWLLGDFPNVQFASPEDDPASWHAAFLLIDEAEADRAEQSLTGNYFKETIRPRGSANETHVLYLNTAQFGILYPGRPPDFLPTVR